jgi:WD repeat-containing protein 61
LSVTAVKDGSKVIGSYQDSKIRFFDRNLNETDCIESTILESWSISLSPNDDVLVSGTHRGSVNIWTMQPGHEKVATLETHNKFILNNVFSCDVKLGTVGVDGFLNVFDMNTQQIIHKVEAHALPIRSLAFSPDGTLIYTASDDRHVSIFDTISGTIVNTFSQAGLAYSVDTSSDFRHFAVGCSDKTVKIWDLGMQKCIHTFDQHNDQVWAVKFDKSDSTGKRLASVGDDALLQLYE